VHTLRGAGYHSTLIGVQHVAKDAAMIGYDQVVKLPRHNVDHVAPAARQFLEHPPAQPFFLAVGFSEVHREFPTPGPAEAPGYCLPPAPLPDTPETRRDMAAFKAGARALDGGIGVILQALEATGLADNTLVICTTDHGIAFPGLKCNLTDHGLGVMLIMRGPYGFNGGQVSDAMISQIDIFPTLCDLLAIEPPPWLQGKSMLPLIRGEAEQINDEIFAEVTYHAAYEPKRAARTRRYKYIRHYGDRAGPVLPNCDDSISKDVWLNHGWRDRTIPRERLYDLIFDPHETHNLANDRGMASVLADMRGRLDRWMQATYDPLLAGAVTAPPGAEVNDPDGLSPREPTQVAR
jgi:arylsulfatase A-like enzyme